MTIAEVLRLEALAAAAAAGPWELSSDTPEWIHVEADGHTVAECRTHLNHQFSDEQNARNAAFIAESREAVPRLTEEVKALRLLLAEAHGALLVLLGPAPTPKGREFLARVQAALTGDR